MFCCGKNAKVEEPQRPQRHAPHKGVDITRKTGETW